MPYADPEKRKAFHAAWRIINAAKIKIDKKAQYQANKELRKAQSKAWIAANPERAKATREAYHIANIERILACRKARYADYRLNNPLPPKLSEEELKARRRVAKAAYVAANKEKIIASNAAYRLNNAEKVKAAGKKWAQANPENGRAKTARWMAANPGKAAKLKKARRKANPEHTRAEKAKIRAIKLRATPGWADFIAIKVFYVIAAERERSTGVPHEVDHIVPLQSKRVCGLHVECNLQVMTAEANGSKGNRIWPQMP